MEQSQQSCALIKQLRTKRHKHRWPKLSKIDNKINPYACPRPPIQPSTVNPRPHAGHEPPAAPKARSCFLTIYSGLLCRGVRASGFGVSGFQDLRILSRLAAWV